MQKLSRAIVIGNPPLWGWQFLPLRLGIEPRSPTWQAGILTTILTEPTLFIIRCDDRLGRAATKLSICLDLWRLSLVILGAWTWDVFISGSSSVTAIWVTAFIPLGRLDPNSRGGYYQVIQKLRGNALENRTVLRHRLRWVWSASQDYFFSCFHDETKKILLWRQYLFGSIFLTVFLIKKTQKWFAVKRIFLPHNPDSWEHVKVAKGSNFGELWVWAVDAKVI